MGEGKKRRSGQASQRGHLSLEELHQGLAEIAASSDRVAAIMGCAMVENALVGAIITSLKDSSDAAKLFDDVRGPFNTFYSQIVAGKALGLFDKGISDALHTVRQIRNSFAHAVLSLAFEDAEISENAASFSVSSPTASPLCRWERREPTTNTRVSSYFALSWLPATKFSNGRLAKSELRSPVT